MPIIKSAIKRARQTLKKHSRNAAIKKTLRTTIKTFNATPSATSLSEAQGQIDRMVKKNLLNKRTAARRKSALSRVAQNAGVKLAAAPKKAAAPAKKATVKATTPKKKPVAKKPTAKK